MKQSYNKEYISKKLSIPENREKKRKYDREWQRKQHLKNPGHNTKINNLYRKKFPEKFKAQQTLNRHLRAGKIIKSSCEKCGERKTQAHHPDYSNPLSVKWLCSIHHKEIHLLNKIND